MKLRNRITALLCSVLLLVGLVPVAAVSAALGGDFTYTPADKPLLIEQILQRDGLIDGIWFPWFDGGNVGHSLTGNETMVRYQGSSWSKVALDTVGADKIYREIYNLKAMGYNVLGYGASIYDEGVIHDAYGDVVGIKQEFLDNSRRLLDMCREIGMPVMWTVCFHSSSAPGYYGIESYDIFSQKYCNPEVTEHYVERFVRPMCKMLAEYKDIVALVAIADEPENEINDSEKGNHFGGLRAPYGVNLDNMVHFMSRINDVVKEELPDVARTVASNDEDKTIYNGFDMDLMGHNVYHNNCHTPDVEDFKTDAPIILTEYNVGDDLDRDQDLFTKRLIEWRQVMMEKGYKGGVQWAWMSHGTHGSTAYYLLDSVSWGDVPNTDFVSSVGELRRFMDDYRAEYRGEKVVLDKPVLYCNEGGGYVEWIPSRQATKMDILRSTDGGKSWTYVLKNANQSAYIIKNKGTYLDEPVPNSMYKIVVRDEKGNTAESDPGNVAGVELKYKKETTKVVLSGPTGIGRHSNTYSRYRLYSFGEMNNRPMTDAANLLKNGSFESVGGQWNNGNFTAAAQVVTDATAPDGSKVLYFDATGNQSNQWYTFTVPIEPYTDYVFSAWIKGNYLSASNGGNASIGVVAPDTGKFMYGGSNASRDNNQLYPPSWDGEWHLRSVAFNSSDMTKVTIALYGGDSHLYVDDMALFRNGDGVKYMGTNMKSELKLTHDVAYTVCDPADSLVTDYGMDSTTYWQSGHGWRNNFLSMNKSSVGYGNSLKYTGSADAYGLYYIKWIPVESYTTYTFSFDMKVLEDGWGKLLLIDERKTGPSEVLAFECDTAAYGTEWKRYSVNINTRGFKRVGIAVCDLGGSALYDNIRLFKKADGIGVRDLYISSVKKTDSVAYGKSASVTVGATGEGLKYQWYYKDKGASKFSLTTSFTGKTYSAKMDTSRDGRQIYCVVTDKYGNSRKTATTTLTVKRTALKITTQPSTGYAQLNKTAKATVKATGDGLTYTWYVKNAGASKYSKSSITSSTYSVKMTEKVHGRRVYCVVKDVWGKTVQSKTVLLRRAASIVTQPKTTTVKKNATAKVTVKAAGDGLKYTWYIKNAGSSKYSKSSITKSTYSVKMTSKVNGRYIYCVVTDKYGKTVKTSTVRVKMK